MDLLSKTEIPFSDSNDSPLLNDEMYQDLTRQLDASDYPKLVDELEYDTKYDFNLALNHGQLQQPHVPIPIKDEFAGEFDFQVLMNNQSNAKHVVYSPTLNKVYIRMEETLPLKFKWRPPYDGLLLRTAMVYSLDEYQGHPVQRCHNHKAPNNRSNMNISPEHANHVVRCLHQSSIYEERSGHYSVVVPLGTPQAGSQYVPVHFQFFCKNSCTSGMNRRPTELIFTLEDPGGNVMGRRRLQVRVCSCPKRDKGKEEGEMLPESGGKKRKISSVQTSVAPLVAPLGKKLVRADIYNVQLSIPGKECYEAVMRFAYDFMAGKGQRTGQLDFFKPYMDSILQKMQEQFE